MILSKVYNFLKGSFLSWRNFVKETVKEYNIFWSTLFLFLLSLTILYFSSIAISAVFLIGYYTIIVTPVIITSWVTYVLTLIVIVCYILAKRIKGENDG